MALKKLFSSQVKRVYNDYRICVITHECDDFGNRRNVENLITIDQAKEMLENLKSTIEEFKTTQQK